MGIWYTLIMGNKYAHNTFVEVPQMNIINLTKAERKIMEIIWEHKEISNMAIFELIGEETDWSRHTVKTYTSALSEKGILGINQISPRKMKYYPLVTKEKYLAWTTSNHLRNNYSKLSYMIAGLINNEQVTPDEINELEQLIKSYKEKMND